MKAVVVAPNRTCQLQDQDKPDIPEGGALIKVLGCGLCGSDVDKWLHRPIQNPVVLGHEVVGILEELSFEAKLNHPEYKIGDRVALAHHVPCKTCYYCLHGSPSMCRVFKQSNITPGGFAEYIAVTDQHLTHSVFAIASLLSDAAGSCIEPLACCLRAIERLPLGIGKEVLVVGLGFVGMLTSQALMHQGYKSYGVDLIEPRVQMALQHQMVVHAESSAGAILETIGQETAHRGVDIVFLSVVTPKTLDLALKAVRDGGCLVLFSAYEQDLAILDQNQLYFREISVVTSYSPGLPHLQKAFQLLSSGEIQVDSLYTHTYSLNQLEEALAAYKSGQAVKVFIRL